MTSDEPSTWPFSVLTSAFCPDFDPGRLLMAICVGYFERMQASRVFTVAGLVASKTRWRQFEPLWTRTLRHDDLAAFNAANFNAGADDFARGWNGERRQRLIDALGRLTEQHALRAFACSVCLDAYEWINSAYQFEESAAGPYGLCSGMIMASVRRWMAARHPEDLTLFVFEEGPLDPRELRRISEAEASPRGEPAQIWPRLWLDELGRSRRLRPFEACDLLAVADGQTLTARLRQRSRLDSEVIDRARLLRICCTLGVPRRDSFPPAASDLRADDLVTAEGEMARSSRPCSA